MTCEHTEDYGSYDGPAACRRDLVVEQVVQTTYNLVCPVHGVVSERLSLRETEGVYRCPLAHDHRSADLS